MEGLISKKAAANINMDRISHLPEPLIQHILSLLNCKESARTGFLSKSLLNAWSTRPVLDFDIACLNHNCMELVLKSLQFYHKERLPLLKFKLHIKGPKDQVAQNWLFSVIKLALINGIVDLDLSTNYFNYFRLPFQDKRLKWCNLKKLKLEYLYVNDHTLSYMISSCPLLSHLHLEGCHGLNKILSLRIPNLREFYLNCIGNPMEEVDISAPKLESFKSTCVGVVHIDEGTSLKSLSISDSTMEQVRFQRLLSRCLFLEDLSLTWCGEINTLEVSSHSIKFLRLNECHRLDSVDIDAPNLLLLECINTNEANRLPFVISRAARKPKCCRITYWCDNGSGQDQSAALRQLMTNFQSSTLTVQSLTYHRWPTFLQKLYYDNIPLQPINEHHFESLTVKYRIINESEIEGFLEMCRPKYFICEYLADRNDNHIIMRNLCNDLWRINKHADENIRYGGCPSKLDCRCWRHYVKEARICYVVGNEHTLINYDLVRLSRATQTGKVKISFALNWKRDPNLSS